MLARIGMVRLALVMCLLVQCAFAGTAAKKLDDVKSHVVVIVSDNPSEAYFRVVPSRWSVQTGRCKVSPSSAATLASVMYGQPALQSGVVSDYDWRRYPVIPRETESILDLYKVEGYETYYLSDPHDGGKLISAWGKQNLPKPIEVTEKPVFVIIQQGGCYDFEAISKLLGKIRSSAKRRVVQVDLNISNSEDSSKRGISADQYHYEATWSVCSFPQKIEVKAPEVKAPEVMVDFQLYELLKGILERGEMIKIKQPNYHFFHRGNWSADESSEKYRHRDSLVIGQINGASYALVDGIELYPATSDLEPDMSKPLDISEYEDVHTEMLMQHSRWWERARYALTDQRAFTVGSVDAVRLTALDWRPSNIIHADDSSPLSKPLAFQKDLMAILQGLRNKEYREKFPAYSGSWAVNIEKSGRYKVRVSKLPQVLIGERDELAKLQAGRAFIKLGGRKVEMLIPAGATVMSANIDADAGIKDLECWFTGQLSLERELGAFFVEIQYVGEKKYDLKAQ